MFRLLFQVNCSFYFKIGACRHGEKCSRTHIMPSFSQTVLLKNLYHNPLIDTRQADAFAKVCSNSFLMQTILLRRAVRSVYGIGCKYRISSNKPPRGEEIVAAMCVIPIPFPSPPQSPMYPTSSLTPREGERPYCSCCSFRTSYAVPLQNFPISVQCE